MPAHANQIVFIDASLPDLATLRAGLPAAAAVHLLDPQQDGLQQIAAVLQGQTGIPTLHLITHGAPGQLHFGARRLTSADFSAYEDELHAISNAMVEDGELLIYGCEVAAGREGRLFVDALTEMTGLKVAAATHKVGTAELGGSWQLNAGMPVAQTLRVAGWQHVLAKLGYTVIPQPTTLAGGSAYYGGITMDANGKIVTGAFAYATYGEDHRIPWQTPAESLLIKADPALLRIALHNLIDNALAHSPSAAAPINVTRVLDGEHIDICVADHGTGIPDAMKQHIFERFYSSSSGDLRKGLGLSIVRTIIARAHGGDAFALDNTPYGTPHGTLMVLRLPFPATAR